jgi:alanine dehydrogenase
MIVGITREIKADEYRVALLPVGAELLVQDGHTVLLERGAGLGSGFEDADYEAAGAALVDAADEVYARADLVVKVKEPQDTEIARLRRGQVVFCFFHFAASRSLTEACLRAGIAAVAYETLQDPGGRLPLLTPMSEVAGKMSIQEGAKYLEKPMMGRGILLGGVGGGGPAHVHLQGGGGVGSNAARVAAGLGANVVVMDTNLDRLRYLYDVMPANAKTIYSDPHAIAWHAVHADLVVGAVLVPGSRAPVLVDAGLVKEMKNGAVIVDVSVDQGGCVETIRPTTHHAPTYMVDGVVHYGVTNMPGAVGRTSSQALCHATLPYVRELAGLGVKAFAARGQGHAMALNMQDGRLINAAVSAAFPDLPH